MPCVLGVNGLTNDVDVEVGSLEKGENLSREELSESLTLERKKGKGRTTRSILRWSESSEEERKEERQRWNEPPSDS